MAAIDRTDCRCVAIPALIGISGRPKLVQVKNITLARSLAKELDVGDAVPVKWYQAVAEVLSMVYKLKKPAA